MNCYIISYDLRQPNRNYDELIARIQSQGKWGKILESLWIINTNKSAIDLWNDLWSTMDENDWLFVVKSWWEAAWKNTICDDAWLQENL